MSNDKKNYITKRGAEKLKAEYKELFHNERPKLVEVVAWAASNGDRSENADYIYGKRRLREIDRKIQWISEKLESSQIVDPALIKSDVIVFGATVSLLDEDDQKKTYQIVGPDEAAPEEGRISWLSPLGKLLLGKSLNSQIILERPSGEMVFVIEKIEYF